MKIHFRWFSNENFGSDLYSCTVRKGWICCRYFPVNCNCCFGSCQKLGYIQRGRQEIGKPFVSNNHLNSFSITQDSSQNIGTFNSSKSITISSSQNIGISSSKKSYNISSKRQNIAYSFLFSTKDVTTTSVFTSTYSEPRKC